MLDFFLYRCFVRGVVIVYCYRSSGNHGERNFKSSSSLLICGVNSTVCSFGFSSVLSSARRQLLLKALKTPGISFFPCINKNKAELATMLKDGEYWTWIHRVDGNMTRFFNINIAERREHEITGFQILLWYSYCSRNSWAPAKFLVIVFFSNILPSLIPHPAAVILKCVLLHLWSHLTAPIRDSGRDQRWEQLKLLIIVRSREQGSHIWC